MTNASSKVKVLQLIDLYLWYCIKCMNPENAIWDDFAPKFYQLFHLDLHGAQLTHLLYTHISSFWSSFVIFHFWETHLTMFLPSWVATKDSAAPEGGSEISIEKLETQLNTLKTMFAEKQKLVSDLEAYGPEG